MKFTPDLIWKVYELGRKGMGGGDVTKWLGIDEGQWRYLCRTHPEVKKAHQEGLNFSKAPSKDPGGNPGGETFFDYVQGRLPKELVPLWERIKIFDEEDNAKELIEKLFNEAGMRYARMQLWVHAFVSGNFNMAYACRMVNMSRHGVRAWMVNEPKFRELCKEIQEIKKDFVESCLMTACKQGETAAIMFSARSLLADRGYNPKAVVQHEGIINHLHESIGELSEEELKKLTPQQQRDALQAMRTLRALREKQAPKIVEALPDIKAITEGDDDGTSD